MSWSIIVHGGAGNIPDAHEEAHKRGCKRAAQEGASVLERGGSALDACCAAVRVLEDDPVYNACIGGALDAHGAVACDAAVMTGEDLGYGAIGAVVGVRHPIDLARSVMEDGRHCLLVGPSALHFARERSVALCDPALHITERTQAEWAARKALIDAGQTPPSTVDWTPLEEGDTVGAVARDGAGRVAAATSTAGLLMRVPGRVGDSPIAGSGTYADAALGAMSATGHGETMMRTVFSLRALQALSLEQLSSKYKKILEEQLSQATAKIGGKGGAIAVLPSGETAYARNTKHMGVAWVSQTGSAGVDF